MTGATIRLAGVLLIAAIAAIQATAPAGGPAPSMRAAVAFAAAGDQGSDCCFGHPSPGCDDPRCESAVCVVDPFCCDNEWDSVCAEQATLLCPTLCGIVGTGSCCKPHDTPGCDDPECQKIVCAEDPFCCQSSWDSTCADAALLLCPICAGGQDPIIEKLQLEQVDWDMDATGVVDDSEYAHLELLVQTHPTGLRFLNIVGASPVNPTDVGWLVENMPLLPTDHVGPLYATCRTVDLTKIGLQRGDEATGLLLSYTTVITDVPLSLMPSMDPIPNVIVIGERLYSFGRELLQFLTNLIPPIAPMRPAWDGDLTSKLRVRFGMPNPDQGRNQCGPGALANSFHWMQAQYPDNVDLGGQTWLQTLQKFKTSTGYRTCCGIGQKQAIEGKLMFAQDDTKTFDPGLQVKYMADHAITNLDREKVIVGNQKARRNGPSQKPTFAWLLAEVQSGEDVEVSIDWLDAMGNKTGGHVVSISAIATLGNKTFVWTHDDGTQSAKTLNNGGTDGGCCLPNSCTCVTVSAASCANQGGRFLGAGTTCDAAGGGTPPNNGGTRNYLAHQVTIENNGYMRFSGFAQNNRIKAIYSESVGEPYLAADVDNDGDVDVDDLVAVIVGWGPCPAVPAPCPGDVTGDDMVNVDDIVRIITNWSS